MKDFLKIMLATMAGMLLFSVVWIMLLFSFIGSVAALSSDTPVVPEEGVLYMDMSNFVIAEKENPMDVSSLMQANLKVKTLSLLSAIQALNIAAEDPGIKYIYMRPDGVSAGIADIEELRKAILKFRESGKAVISFVENPSNASYYLASAADKVYVTASKGGMNMVLGLSSQMFFLKDLLDKLGVNMQLIRHGKYKSAGEMYIKNRISKENYEQTHAMISSIWNSWVSDIAASRNISPEDFNALLDNLSLVEPEDFVEAGLADAQLGREDRKQKLCDLYMVEDFNDVQFIPFEDYTIARTSAPVFGTNQIAVIYADGEIVDGSDDPQNVAGDTFAEMIAQVRANDMVKAVVLRVNSPGGSVLASDKIRRELQLLRESKPVVASYGNYAASGGYWISAESDYIFSDATTLTGSIGVFSLIPDFGKAVKDLAHINVTNVNSNRHSDMYFSMRPLDEDETAYAQKSVENIYEEFTSIVADGRGLRKTYVDSIAQGRVWAGADALKIGLVDEIGGLEDALNMAAFKADGSTSYQNFHIARYPAPQTPLESILAAFQGTNTPLVFAGTPFEAVERAFAPLKCTDTGKIYARLPYEYIIQ